MALTLTTSSKTEVSESNQMGRSLVTGQYYNSEKTVEKFINAYQTSEELQRINPRSIVNDPTVTGFKLFFHFAAKDGLLADEIYPNSAAKFFKDVGDDYRYDLLKVFKSRLSELNSEQPWVFHTIEGLREIYTNPWDSVSYYSKTNKITINTYETLDHKVAALNRMWRVLYWDSKRGVMTLPENLRQFSMSVYLLDMRVFSSKFKFLRTWENQSIANVTHQLVDIGHCQFLNESGGEFFGTITNMSVQETFNSFVIGYDTASVSGLSPTMTGDLTLSKSETELVTNVIGGKTKDFTMDKLIRSFSEGVQDKAQEYLQSQESFVTYQKEKLLKDAKNDLSYISAGFERSVPNIAQLTYGNIQGAVLRNLNEVLGNTKFDLNIDRSTLSGNEPSLSLDTKQLKR